MNLTMENLQNCFKAAKDVEAKFVAVLIQMDGFASPEVIVNTTENIETKLAYYEKTYDENLQHKHAFGIKIIGCTFGYSLIDIEADLLGGEPGGMNLQEMIAQKTEFGFGMAVDLMKEGHTVTRKGWNGKGMYLFLIGVDGSNDYWTYTNGKNDNYPLLPFIAMKTADDKVVPWLASQTDMLAEDWMVLK